MKAKGTITIETPRLILRKITLNDAPAMFSNWAADPEVTKYLSWSPHSDISVTENVITSWINRYHSNLFFEWVIDLKTIEEAIGTISLLNIDESLKQGEVGYCMSKTYWNQGLMSEALKYILDYLVKETNFKIINARHDIDNPSSGKVMIKNGFHFVDNQSTFSKKMNKMLIVSHYQIDLEALR